MNFLDHSLLLTFLSNYLLMSDPYFQMAMTKKITVLEEEKRKFRWFYEYKVSREAQDGFKINKKAKKREN